MEAIEVNVSHKILRDVDVELGSLLLLTIVYFKGVPSFGTVRARHFKHFLVDTSHKLSDIWWNMMHGSIYFTLVTMFLMEYSSEAVNCSASWEKPIVDRKNGSLFLDSARSNQILYSQATLEKLEKIGYFEYEMKR
jgi:hypothetical protein